MIARLPLARVGIACIALGLLLALWIHYAPGEATQAPAQTAESRGTPADTDGEVPVKGECEPDGNPQWGEDWVGRYQYKTIKDDEGNAQEIQGTIYVNICHMDDLGFTREKKLGVIRHEKAHSKGWDHGEGTPETNPAYYADYDFAR